MTGDPKDILLEAAVTAFRERNSWGRIMPSPAWCDLPPGDRLSLFERQLDSRLVERAFDPGGASTTVRAVLERLKAGGLPGPSA